MGIARTCDPGCDPDDEESCPDGFRCNADINACEFSCDDAEAADICDELGGTCEEDGDDEYCVLP